MTLPLWYLLIPFAVVVLGTAIFAFFNVYHVAKFGVRGPSSTALVVLYSATYLLILGASYVLLGSYDWHQHIALADILPFTGGDSTPFGL